MKKHLLFTLIIGFVYLNQLQAQQLPLYSQYIMNDIYINPAIAGTKDYNPLVLSVRKQWIGINNTPATQTISYHMPIKKQNIGVGGILFNDSFGPESHLGLQLLFSYQLNINETNKVSFGLAGVAMQYKMDQRLFELTDYYDPAVTYKVERTIVPDANIGIYFYGEKYYAGITAAHLFQSKLKVNNNIQENTMSRHYFILGGYKFTLPNDRWEIEPSLLLKFTESTPIQIDINAKVYYNRNFWFGASLRPRDAFIANVGFKYKQYYIGYAYDITFSAISRYTYGSQEIIFGVNFNENSKRKRSKGFF
jgi:type IX secretion system PorP/SprF family membrane protein